MAGWASNNKYAMLGSLRSSSQMISYELSMGFRSLVDHGFFQREVGRYCSPTRRTADSSWSHCASSCLQIPKWGIFIQPLGFLIFLVSVFAETNRLPFDFPKENLKLLQDTILSMGQ